MSKWKWGLLLVLGMANLTCGDAPMVAAPGGTLTLIANPPFIVANGGVSVISAFIVDANGTPAANGTVVFFFTTLGSIEPQGRTKDGVARVNLVADSRSGTAEVTASSGAADLTATLSGDSGVVIGSARPASLALVAEPLRVRPGAPSYLTANVFDADGNPVANVPVIFTLMGGTGRETLDRGSAQVFTDTNGQAFNVLLTSSNLSDVVTVTAETSDGGATDSVDVGVNQTP